MKDLGTLGGLNGMAWTVSNRGQVVAGADINEVVDPVITSYTFHGFVWDKGIKTDIGTLVPDGRFSEVFAINSKGQAAGYAATSEVNPVGFPIFHAILWEDGVMQDLGTLGGSYSFAEGINNRGQIVGWAASTELDPNFGDQVIHAFRWEDGVMTDLGTLGGPSSVASGINERGQVVGAAHINSVVDPAVGEPLFHAFLWQGGGMQDLGTLGGKVSFATEINNRGQVVGDSLVTGDTTAHAFLWEDGVITDLNSQIPANSSWELLTAQGINDRGEIVGGGLINGEFHAFLLTPSNCNSHNSNSSPSLLTKSRANTISMASLAQQYRGLPGKASFRGAPWLLKGHWKTGIGKRK
jgi:probable HAF family extracellular repeat protein